MKIDKGKKKKTQQQLKNGIFSVTSVEVDMVRLPFLPNISKQNLIFRPQKPLIFSFRFPLFNNWNDPPPPW